jgi:hypothetical protein
MTKPTIFIVIFRTGGTVNFRWNRSVGFINIDEALACCESVRKMGYPAFAVDLEKVEQNGLPIDYIPEQFENWFKENPNA